MSKNEREKQWRKAKRRTLAFEMNVEADADVLEFWAEQTPPKVEHFRRIMREYMEVCGWKGATFDN